MKEKVMENNECKHLNASITGREDIMKAECPDCYRDIGLAIIFNNWLEELRRLRADLLEKT